MIDSKNIVITGVSTGIGYDLAKVFLREGYQVYGSVRKQADADRLQQEFGFQFHALVFDVTDHDAIDRAALELTRELGDEGLCGLVNNAGIAVGGPLMDLSIEEYRNQFEVNVFGLIKVTQAFLPLLGARKGHLSRPGKIVQISSVAGKFGMPFMSAYAGSKHAVEGVSDSLRRELQKFGIDVILIEPGPIKTPIWEKSGAEANTRFAGSLYEDSLAVFQSIIVNDALKSAWTSERAARAIFRRFAARNSPVRVALVPKRITNWILPKLIPTRWVDRIIGKKLKLIDK